MTYYPPAAMVRRRAAAYCDLSEAEFDREVAAGRLPQPFRVGRSNHWSRQQLDKALAVLAGEGGEEVVVGRVA